MYTWQCPDHKRAGVDDMTLLPQVKDSAIVENLKKRFDCDWIFTYIGNVLITVNPFKQMKYFTQREVDMYQGAVSFSIISTHICHSALKLEKSAISKVQKFIFCYFKNGKKSIFAQEKSLKLPKMQFSDFFLVQKLIFCHF